MTTHAFSTAFIIIMNNNNHDDFHLLLEEEGDLTSTVLLVAKFLILLFRNAYRRILCFADTFHPIKKYGSPGKYSLGFVCLPVFPCGVAVIVVSVVPVRWW